MKTPTDRIRTLFAQTVLKAYGTSCMHCGIDNPSAQVDHIYPRSIWKDQHFDPHNAQVLCPDCNRIKADTVVDYRPAYDSRINDLRIAWCEAIVTRCLHLQASVDLTIRLAKKGKL